MVHANGQIFGGAVTMSALYRGENGMDKAAFLDLATRDPQGRLYPAFGKGNYCHGTLSNPRFVDYCLKWAFRQIDVVNSVAMGGAQLEIHLDGHPALRERLPDKDRRNDPFIADFRVRG